MVYTEVTDGQLIKRYLEGDEGALENLLSVYEELVTGYAGSENIDVYRYLYANYLFLTGKSDKALEILDAVETEDRDMIESVEMLRSEIIGTADAE